jgi:lipopolysaccharide transport system permease protein
LFRALAVDVQEMIQEQFDFWELLYQMSRRDLMLRYKQTVMGFGWAVFMPLLNTLIFTMIFTRGAKIDVGMPYPVFAYCGLLAWNFFASSLRFSVSSLTANINLVAKVYFPREIFPFSAVFVSFVDFLVGAVILVALMIYYHVTVTPAIAFLPLIVLVEITFAAGMALFLAMANLFYRDVKYLFEVVITLWMFASSVVIPVSSLGGKLQVVLSLNPMTPIIDAYRDVLLKGTLPDMVPFTLSAALSFAVLAIGWVTFHRSEYQFAEYI